MLCLIILSEQSKRYTNAVLAKTMQTFLCSSLLLVGVISDQRLTDEEELITSDK